MSPNGLMVQGAVSITGARVSPSKGGEVSSSDSLTTQYKPPPNSYSSKEGQRSIRVSPIFLQNTNLFFIHSQIQRWLHQISTGKNLIFSIRSELPGIIFLSEMFSIIPTLAIVK